MFDSIRIDYKNKIKVVKNKNFRILNRRIYVYKSRS